MNAEMDAWLEDALMTRDELVDRLAETIHYDYPERGFSISPWVPWEEAKEYRKQRCRDEVMQNWPVYVQFVAQWIEKFAPYEVEPGWLAHQWREEMGR